MNGAAAQIAAAPGGRQSGAGWVARCPAHDDHTPSLSIRDGDDTDEDARQIAKNVTGFFAILVEWVRAETPSPANEAGKSFVSVHKEVRHGR